MNNSGTSDLVFPGAKLRQLDQHILDRDFHLAVKTGVI